MPQPFFDIDITSQATTGSLVAGRGIRRLTKPVVAYIIEQPTAYEGFATFRCGDANTEEAVREVQQTAGRLYTNTTTMTQTPVVVEDDSGGIVGYCSIHRRTALSAEPWIAERYIVAFGRDLTYRKYLLRDGVTHVGEALIRAGLDMIALEAKGRSMPSVSALVKPENGNSHRVLEAFDFECTPTTSTGFGQDLLWRESGLAPPSALPLGVYVPPERPAPPPKPPGRNDPCTCGSGRKYKKCCGR